MKTTYVIKSHVFAEFLQKYPSVHLPYIKIPWTETLFTFSEQPYFTFCRIFLPICLASNFKL